MKGYLKPCRAQAAGTRHLVSIVFTVLSSMAVYGQAAAQVTPPIGDPPIIIEPPPTGYPPTVAPSAAGPYFASPAWDQTLAPNVRFIILANMNSDAVLDRETGLVWARQRAPGAGGRALVGAVSSCLALVVGNRGGWRLPTASELRTLVDFSVPVAANALPRMPAGHPFLLEPLDLANTAPFEYWTSEPLRDFFLAGEEFGSTVNLTFGSVNARFPSFENGALGNGALCVRGRQ